MGDHYETLLTGLEPLPETIRWLREQGELREERILYQQESLRDPLTGIRERSVRCVCTACQGSWYATKIPAGGCSSGYAQAPFGFLTEEREAVIQGKSTDCPCCGERARAEYTGRDRWGEEYYMCGAHVTEVRRLDGRLVLAEWNVRKLYAKNGNTFLRAQPWTAFVIEEKTMIRMNGACRNMGSGWRYHAGFERRKQYQDDMGACDYVAPWDPALLNGTAAENSKLDIYITEGLKRGVCHPVSYLRAWQRHRNLENLVSAGAGGLVAELLAEEFDRSSGSGHRCMRRVAQLEQINFKEKRPSRMLGMDTETFRECVRGEWNKDTLRAWRILEESGEAYEIDRDLPTVKQRLHEVHRIRRDGWPLLRTLRYLEKQGLTLRYLRDYRSMAAEAGWNMDHERNLWPRDLRAAHDQAMWAELFKKDAEKQADFDRILERYGALEWTDGELCIRLPRAESELVMEGATLEHCVGRYGNDHVKGKLVLFVRRRRRPERSYYTLNEDLRGDEPLRIQLHGYRNEWYGDPIRCKHQIPKRVTDFVARWEREVLEPFMRMEAKRRRGEARQEKKEAKTA